MSIHNEQKAFFEKFKPCKEDEVYAYYYGFDEEYNAYTCLILTEELLQAEYDFFTGKFPVFQPFSFEYTQGSPIKNAPENKWFKAKLDRNGECGAFNFRCGVNEMSESASLEYISDTDKPENMQAEIVKNIKNRR